jgi:hypothetical protein
LVLNEEVQVESNYRLFSNIQEARGNRGEIPTKRNKFRCCSVCLSRPSLQGLPNLCSNFTNVLFMERKAMKMTNDGHGPAPFQDAGHWQFQILIQGSQTKIYFIVSKLQLQ